MAIHKVGVAFLEVHTQTVANAAHRLLQGDIRLERHIRICADKNYAT